MNRLALSGCIASSFSSTRRGYTLIEILVATALSLMILGAVVQLFGTVGTTITESRSVLEAADRLRSAQIRLQMDLGGITVTPMPPRRPEYNEGYLEIIEGPVVQTQTGVTGTPQPQNSEKLDASGNPIADTTVGDFDDILMFTTRTTGKPFVGRFAGNAVESDVAEVAWFIRGRDLHRRVLLVAPGVMAPQSAATIAPGFYLNNDISIRLQNGYLVPNTLGDLTRRECRYAHSPGVFPFESRGWGQYGLPTLRECSLLNNTTLTKSWNAGTWIFPAVPAPQKNVDFWTNASGQRLTDDGLTTLGTNPSKSSTDNISERIADDVILTNVIGFDVKVWEPSVPAVPGGTGNLILLDESTKNLYNKNTVIGYGAYVNLGYYPSYSSEQKRTVPPPLPQPQYDHQNNPQSGLRWRAITSPQCVYDTWSTTYNGPLSSDGFDNTSVGIVDNDSEKANPPPYDAPLRGIQVKIRIFEPDSRQIREVTVEQDFLPK